MIDHNPLLADTDSLAFSAIRPEHVPPAVRSVIEAYRAEIEALLADPALRTFANTMLPQERLEHRLERVWAPIAHLQAVCDSEALRVVYAEAEQRITEHAAELGQNRALYAAVAAVRNGPEFAKLPRPARTLVEHALRDFRRAGVALEEPARSRFRAIVTELAQLGTEFENAVLDATEAWSEPVDEAALAGVPEIARAALACTSAESDRIGYRVTLHEPCVHAILTHAANRSLRERVYTAYYTRASDQGPHAGRFDNSERIERILALRHEAAQLLGFANAAEESLATKMAATPQRVLDFLRDLAAHAKPAAEREWAELCDFARTELGLADLAPWDLAYAAERLRQHTLHWSEEALKPYFPLPTVLHGLFALIERVFGVRLRLRPGVDVWHPDVQFYDVLDADGQVRAGIYLDLYTRIGKRGGAWMDVCRSRFRDGARLQTPIAFLTCNFAPPPSDRPSLLGHDEVTTLFHEFGHGLHLLLTEVDLPSVSGLAGVEWDAVELPSQLLETFAWEREALALVARHWQTGAPLPEAAYPRLHAARRFHAGLYLVRQLEYALFDLRLHLDYDPRQGARALALLDEVRREVAVLVPPPWQRLPHSFDHIFGGGYDAGYYGYLWAEMLAADAFTQFEEQGILDRAVGEAFRRSILAVGGSRPALESFIEFRGRPPRLEALLRRYGLAP